MSRPRLRSQLARLGQLAPVGLCLRLSDFDLPFVWPNTQSHIGCILSQGYLHSSIERTMLEWQLHALLSGTQPIEASRVTPGEAHQWQSALFRFVSNCLSSSIPGKDQSNILASFR